MDKVFKYQVTHSSMTQPKLQEQTVHVDCQPFYAYAFENLNVL